MPANLPDRMLLKLAAAATSNAYLLLTLAALFWSGNNIIGRGMHGHIPPIAMATVRWWVSLLLILPFALPYLRRDWAVIRRSLPILIFLGLIGVGCYSTFLYIGLNYTGAINASVIITSGPVLIALTCFIVFGDRFTWRQIAGIAISLAGVAAIITSGDLRTLAALAFNRGDLWVLTAVAAWAVYTAYLRKRPHIHWLSFAAMTFLVAACALTPPFVAEHWSGWQLKPDWATVATLAYISIFPSVIAYLCFNRGVELIGGGRAGAFLYLVPLFGTLGAILFLGETLRLHHVLGLALILLGVTLAARQRKVARPARQP